MEQGINIYLDILECFGRSAADVHAYSSLELAYIGDAVYDLIIRSLIMSEGPMHTDRMHKRTSGLVCAHAQAQVLKAIRPLLTDEEKDIARRGRNAKSATMAKNATAGDYRRATGLEALCGYLYLTGRTARLLELVKAGLEGIAASDEAGKEKTPAASSVPEQAAAYGEKDRSL